MDSLKLLTAESAELEDLIQPQIFRRPTVLVIAGHDPAGAGIQADIETAASLGCYAATLVTCLTTQNSRGVQAILPTPAAALLAQATCLLEDITAPVVCKLGLIPNLETLEVVLEIISRLLPVGTRVVVDPVLGATAGGPLSRPEMAAAIATRLLPVCTVATPNKREFSRLEQAACEPGGAANTADWTLITGADEPGNIIRHELRQGRRRYADYDWPRIDGIFHGSGCTLATAVAAFLAHGMSVPVAVGQALNYTWNTLLRPTAPGGSQYLPGRS